MSTLDFGQLICAEISRPMFIDGIMVVVEACVGASDSLLRMKEVPQGADRGAELMKRVHLAASVAKRAGAGDCVLYSPALDDRTTNQTDLGNLLRQAIEEEQFELHYQPLVDLTSGSIIGAEALIRWSHPELGRMRPDLFIPLAESTRLIVPLGGWITEAVMRQAQSWRRLGITVPPISINLSGVQLRSSGFLRMVEGALIATGCNAADFEFELTEGILIDKSHEVSARLLRLKALGFALALDDFGAGHATFVYLRQFPVDKIKIDKTFLGHLAFGSSDALIVRSMITMARSLGLDVLAEGIESKQQRDFLIEEGCRKGQGNFFSLPLSAEDFARMLEQCVPLPLADAVGEER
jgi:EAL domain-containing protein (putative c-di-GMP-specific phosphodiesterase class I)